MNRTKEVLTAEVKYSSRKIALKTARDGEKTWHMTQLTFSSNFYWNICFKFCILEQIIATVLFLCISSINNKRSSLRFQSTTAPTNRGWSACADTTIKVCYTRHLTFIKNWEYECTRRISLLLIKTYQHLFSWKADRFLFIFWSRVILNQE